MKKPRQARLKSESILFDLDYVDQLKYPLPPEGRHASHHKSDKLKLVIVTLK